ncbi:MAG: topoisomerase DNA-binding C4 zinc finger domain-containing protein, partial [Candidatus Staskawiczbacteria bacterium]|nr:topoisomerase DNA-binding C4 zinc finger domain-containing protein [Candidatus Staskawiczbacteria bacterium]
LEKNGIGRPSTYAPIISTIQDRHYVEKNEQKRFFPSEMGIIVNDVLVENFSNIVDIGFTAKMEENLDGIADGNDKWEKICSNFYGPFAKMLAEKYKDVVKTDLTQETDKICPKCGSPIIERMGRFGRFYACSKFPECKHTESIEDKKKDLGIKCPKCKEGDIISRKTNRGKIFYGCSSFPKCDFALWDKPVNEFCPMCDSILVQKNKSTIKCSNKECEYTKTT